MFRKSSTKKKVEHSSADGSAESARTPRLAFPTTRSRPTSVVDTAGIDASLDSCLSSPSNKLSQSAIERLTSAQRKDAAAVSSSRTRTSSNTSRSSVKLDGSKAVVPSLIKSAAALSPALASTAVLSASTPIDTLPTIPRATASNASPEADRTKSSAASLLSQFGGGESLVRTRSSGGSLRKVSATNSDSGKAPTPHKPAEAERPAPKEPSTPEQPAKVAGSSVSSPSKPAAPPLVALLSDSKVSKLIKQGAEAKVYISQVLTDSVLAWPASSSMETKTVPAPTPVLLKWRFPKTYRHPVLSSNITASRTIMEARALLRCAKANVAVPAVRCVDEKEGILGLELIPGKSVREWLGGGAEGEDEELITSDDTETLSYEDQVKLMQLIGQELAKMHEADIVHGDLTTSNMMLRSNSKTSIDVETDQVVLIDFGLSCVSAFPEDKAVDLYVLERAFASTHPESEELFKTVLESYADEVIKRAPKAKKGRTNRWDEVKNRLEEVRLRGRKRSMVGSTSLLATNHASRFVFKVELSLVFAFTYNLPRQRSQWDEVRKELDDEVGALQPVKDSASFLVAIERNLPRLVVLVGRMVCVRLLPNTLQRAVEGVLTKLLKVAHAWIPTERLKTD